MLHGVHRFFEQDSEVKKQFYTRDVTSKLVYNSNHDLFTSTAANKRDTFFCFMAPSLPQPEELPEPCRKHKVVTSSTMEAAKPSLTSYSNRRSELEAFDDTKTGVKGLVDAGMQKIPDIFIHPPDAFDKNSCDKCKEYSIPIIDLKRLDKDLTSHQEIVDKVCCASETFGFFKL
ncbi:hypothetical protein POM88_026608 [Heracleum sosnowskyi]|uniref:Uncharacterized protein n=1 Tax=Heracleum sosnowskyi TaxID=360622 RepID=A0AAD8MPF4_9APIA|nr:hypothetical protein POM88_026608 [Heracleum sosnowskyi]